MHLKTFSTITLTQDFILMLTLFEALREKKKYDHTVHCISSTVTNIVKNVLRPLPFHPTHIINDTYDDFLNYSIQISRFVTNRLIYQYRFNKSMINHYDDTILHALKFPLQLDFWIIPQCVSESKIQHQHHVITNYEKQCDRLLFGIGDILIKDIGKHLRKFNIDHKEFELDREPTQFYKVLSRGFDDFQNNQRHQRYIIVIDRRCPRYDGKYTLENDMKSWKDKLYIFSPPKFNQISSRCDLFPEGFINRTMEYLLPLKENINNRNDIDNKHDAIGANCIANGYIFALSYHLYQIDKVKVFFHSNGCGQRLTADETKYYWPRLFMKFNGKFQDNLKLKHPDEPSFKFQDISIYDEEHEMFRRSTMK